MLSQCSEQLLLTSSNCISAKHKALPVCIVFYGLQGRYTIELHLLLMIIRFRNLIL